MLTLIDPFVQKELKIYLQQFISLLCTKLPSYFLHCSWLKNLQASTAVKTIHQNRSLLTDRYPAVTLPPVFLMPSIR